MSDEEYLDLYRIGPKKYIIGIFESGITIYKQQVRALNIFKALYDTKQLPNKGDTTIGIIGAGISGLTFASAALKANFNVVLLEKNERYLHLQYGCNIRKVHPYIYEWPDEDTFFPYAKLPILSWKYDTANNVSEELIYQYNKLKNTIKTEQDNKNWEAFHVSKIETKPYKKDKIIIKAETEGENEILHHFCDIVVYAVGFGIEKTLGNDENHPSYWRDDSLHQSFLSATTFVISGVGDGALMDAFRVIIQDFSYEKVFKAFQKDKERFIKLTKELSKIKKDAIEDDGLLMEGFSKIENDLIDYFYKELGIRDAKVFVIGKSESIIEVLNLKRISLLNAFIFHLLHKKRKIDYKQGEVTFSKSKGYKVGELSLKKFLRLKNNTKVKTIIRNGTDRSKVFDNLSFTPEEIENISKIEQLQKSIVNSASPRWKFGDFHSIFNEAIEKTKRIDYLTPYTISLATDGILSIQKLLCNFNKSSGFKTALFRIIDIDDEIVYQQISPTITSDSKIEEQNLGQVFSIDKGNIGLSIQSGSPILILRKSKEKFKDVITLLNLKKDFESIKSINSFLTIPIFGKSKSGNTPNLVLSINAEDIDFFFNAEDEELNFQLFNQILQNIQLFVDHVDDLIKGQKVFTHPHKEIEISQHKLIESMVTNPCFYSQEKLNQLMIDCNYSASFNEYYSFDLIENEGHSFYS